MADSGQSFGNTANARSAMLTSSKDRWSVNPTGGTQGLEGLYANGEGSIYTKLGGGATAQADSSPGLNAQIETGVNFFGYGRGKENMDKRLGDQGERASGTMNIAGQGREKDSAIAPGSAFDFGRFKTKQKAMGQDKSQFGTDGGLKAARASWYTKNVHDSVKYGSAAIMGNVAGGRTESTRGRTNASSLTNGSGKQSKI